MAYTVRRFKETDAAEVSALIIKTLRTVNIKDYSSEYIENDVSFLQPDNILIRNTWQHIYIVQDGNVIVGCGAIGPYYDKLDEASLFTIFVLPEYHGRGIGRMIIETLEKDELFLRSKRIEIPSSITARDFYIKMGYDYKDGITDVDGEQLYKLEKFRPVYFLDSVDSTNIVAKKYAAEGASHGTVVLADSQTAGRGRLGRSFVSPDGSGLYMSIVLRPFVNAASCTSCAACADDIEALYPEAAKKEMRFNPSLVTVAAGVAVVRALKTICDIDAEIKWVNDIYLKDKKVGGILTEAESNFETGKIAKIIIGIGINCFEQVFPDEIADKATFIGNTPKDYSRNDLIAAVADKIFELIDSFDKKSIIREYKSRSMILGQPILIYGTSYGALPENGGRGVKARAIDIDENGGLVVEYSEGRRSREMDTITSGEVTIRKDYY